MFTLYVFAPLSGTWVQCGPCSDALTVLMRDLSMLRPESRVVDVRIVHDSGRIVFQQRAKAAS